MPLLASFSQAQNRAGQLGYVKRHGYLSDAASACARFREAAAALASS